MVCIRWLKFGTFALITGWVCPWWCVQPEGTLLDDYTAVATRLQSTYAFAVGGDEVCKTLSCGAVPFVAKIEKGEQAVCYPVSAPGIVDSELSAVSDGVWPWPCGPSVAVPSVGVVLPYRVVPSLGRPA